MRFATAPIICSVLVGAALGVSGMFVHAHATHSAHGKPGHHGLLSVAGTPSELAERSVRLAEHVCAVIDTGTSCALLPVASLAAQDMEAFKAGYDAAQSALHRALTQAEVDPASVNAAEEQQLAVLDQTHRRYLRFLAQVSEALTAEQRQAFVH